MSIFVLVLSGLSEINKNIPNNIDQLHKNADFGHFKPVFGLFLACNSPGMGVEWSKRVYFSYF